VTEPIRGVPVLTILVWAGVVSGWDLDFEVLRKPAPLPQRWALKLMPETLPELPPGTVNGVWYAREFRFGGIGCGAVPTGVAKTRLRFQAGPPGGMGGVEIEHTEPAFTGRFVTERRARLAVHQSLVEFDGALYTARLDTPKVKGREVRRLELGVAVELAHLVWYQAGTEARRNTLEEWRLEFSDDPRVKESGTMTIRRHRRHIYETEGQSWEVEARFKTASYPWNMPAVPPELAAWRVITVTTTQDAEGTGELPEFVLAGRELRLNFDKVRTTFPLERMSLLPGPPPAEQASFGKPTPLREAPKKPDP
jgi:hypothetical protein